MDAHDESPLEREAQTAQLSGWALAHAVVSDPQHPDHAAFRAERARWDARYQPLRDSLHVPVTADDLNTLVGAYRR